MLFEEVSVLRIVDRKNGVRWQDCKGYRVADGRFICKHEDIAGAVSLNSSRADCGAIAEHNGIITV